MSKSCGFIQESSSLYHSKKSKYLTSSKLKDFIKCPLLYYKKHTGKIPDQDSRPFLVGRATHSLILEGRDTFESSEDASQLTERELCDIEAMYDSVSSHRAASRLLEEGEAEGVIRTDYCGVPCQIRIDWFNPTKGIVDLKTCKDLTWFKPDSRRYLYANQLAFYRSVYHAEVSDIKTPVYLIAVEKQEPYRCAVYKLTDYVLNVKTEENFQAIERLKECQEKGEWPTGFEGIKKFNWL